MSDINIKPPKDFPKIFGQPKPQECTVWSVYVNHDTGEMRARLHVPGNFEQWVCDGKVEQPDAFCDVIEAYRKYK